MPGLLRPGILSVSRLKSDHHFIMIKKDFITSTVLIAFSLSVIVLSYTMPRLERRGIDPFSAPGVVPGMIGCILLILALVLFVRSVRHGGYLLFSPNSTEERVQRGAVLRVVLTLALSLIYAIGLLGHVDYTIGTLLYVFTFIVLFKYRWRKPLESQFKVLGFALLQALIASMLITIVFRKLFLVDLP
ncbi:MAG: tripartite tricarboxylate transporter TctB family protein [Desulfofustis sp.]|nr:tripartite tricarboxylate transporter TctB family protein [Desulfofustis sp.]